MYRAGSLRTVAEEISNYTGGHIEEIWHGTSRRIYIFLSKGELNS
jgi:hypothetical protein